VPGFYRGPNESGEETVGIGGEGASMGSATATLVVSFALSAVLLVGLIASLRQRASAADALVVVSAGMILLVPTRTFRYLLPLAPFLWCYLVTGVAALAAMASRRLGEVRREGAAVAVVALCLIGLQLLDHVQYIRIKSAQPPPAEWLADARAIDDLLLWMDQNLPAGAAVASTNPGLVFLRTGRKGVASGDPARNRHAWQKAGIHYIAALRPMPQPVRSAGFRKLYESRRLWVWGLDNY